jgi:hypothetical protein
MYRSHASVYGPSKPNSLLSIAAWLKPTASLVRVGRETEAGPVDHSTRLKGGVGSSSIRPTLLMTRERLPCTGTARRKRASGVHRLEWEAYVSCWSDFPLQGVHRFESPRLSDMSNYLFVAAIK